MSLGNFLQINFRGWQVLKPTIDIVVDHVPKRISLICSSFLRRGGSITCKVMGPRRFSADLLQGGLEIPCTEAYLYGNSQGY